MLPLPNTSAMMNSDGLSKANFVKSLHEKGKAQIEKKIEQYVRYSNKGRKKMVIKLGETGLDADKTRICVGLLELLMGLRDSGAG